MIVCDYCSRKCRNFNTFLPSNTQDAINAGTPQIINLCSTCAGSPNALSKQGVLYWLVSKMRNGVVTKVR